MKILLWNIEGAKIKLQILSDFTLQQYDILVLVETFATKDLEIEFFTTLNQRAIKPVTGRPMGGITIGVNKRLNMTAKITASDHQFLCVELAPVNLRIIGAYFWPHTELDEIIHPLADLILKTNHITVLCGDFNCRTDQNNPRGEELVDALSSLTLEMA